ncbi:hypothetical protein [Rickettsiella massiliensis]|uniref:hypothetical protein n=1 Tax=Rickettsiella massiliensis TaxID=676517 RepID=UPI000299EB81|nr:hypothetical protein [Rickettsiella massiliensis]
MANPIPYIELGKPGDSSHVKWVMPDPKKEPVFDDFGGLIQQAVSDQGVSCYDELNESMRWALGIAALRENKTLAIDADYNGFNQVLANVFEKRGSLDSLQNLYQYLVRIVIEGSRQYDAQVAYCIDNALEKEEDKQAFNAKYFSHEEEADYWHDEVDHG